MIEDVHNQHIKNVKQSFTTRIGSLERKLFDTESKLLRHQNILENVQTRISLNSPKLSDSILNLLNTSKEANDGDLEKYHQKVIFELEAQLEAMRLECQADIEKSKEE